MWVGAGASDRVPAMGGTSAGWLGGGLLGATVGLLSPALSSIPNGGEGVDPRRGQQPGGLSQWLCPLAPLRVSP